MSLDDLEKRQILKPLEAELDRQKEKNAAVKKRLVALQDYVEKYIHGRSELNRLGGKSAMTPELKALHDAVQESKQV